MNGGFGEERTLAENGAMSESRGNPPIFNGAQP